MIPKELCPSASPSQQPLPPKPYTPITHSKVFLKGTFIFQALHLHQVNTASSHHSPVSLAYMGAAPYNQRSHQVGLVEQKSNLPKYNIKVFICSKKKKKPACNFPTTNFLALTFQIENSLSHRMQFHGTFVNFQTDDQTQEVKRALQRTPEPLTSFG